MKLAGQPAKILLIDTNVYFSKRLSDALKREGFEVNTSTQPSFALTTLEYDSPAAIVCSTNMREMGALDIARMVRADAKNSALPIIALGDGSQRALLEAFQAGCDDYIDRTRPPAVIATHVKNIIVSKAEGFQSTQMLAQSDTSLSGSLSHHDLPGVMQMLGHAHQTGALHINSGDTDALLFFDAGAVTHAECGSFFGDEAVIHILKNCFQNNSGVYKFVYGSASQQRTVLRSATELMLDAMREVDESSRNTADVTPAEISREEGHASDTEEIAAFAASIQSNESPAPAQTDENFMIVPEEDRFRLKPEAGLAALTESSEDSAAAQPVCDSAVARDENQFESAEDTPDSASTHHDDYAAIADLLDRFAMTHSNDYAADAQAGENFGIPDSLDHLAESASFNHFSSAPLPDESAAEALIENSEIPAPDVLTADDQTGDQTDDQSVVTRREEVL